MPHLYSPFEIAMLLCFGISWPFSVFKTFKTKNPNAKSHVFLYLVFTGYVAGTLHKIYYLSDWVIVLYIFNALMVATDIFLCYRYRRNGRVLPVEIAE